MSEAKKINTGVVASLSDTDLLLASDSGGTLRPISLANIKKLLRDDLRIGGRNLIKNSAVSLTTTDYLIKPYTYAEQPAIGERVTISLWGELGSGKEHFTVIHGEYGDGSYGQVELRKVAEGKYQGSMTILKKSTLGQIRFYAYPSSVSGVQSTVSRIKVERGNVATDWSPAP